MAAVVATGSCFSLKQGQWHMCPSGGTCHPVDGKLSPFASCVLESVSSGPGSFYLERTVTTVVYASTGLFHEASQRQLEVQQCSGWPQNKGKVLIYDFPGSANPNISVMCMPGNL